LPPTEGIQTHHGAKEGHRAKDKRNGVSIGPGTDSDRDLLVRGPEERGLRKGNGEAEGVRKGVKALVKYGSLLKGPYNGNVIDVS